MATEATTIEQGLREVAAEFGVKRICIGFSTSPFSKPFDVSVFRGEALATGEGDTIDEALAGALRELGLLAVAA